MTWWTDNLKTLKIREIDYTRTSGKLSQVVTRQYDDLGAVVWTYTETINRTGGKVASVDGVKT